MVNTKKCTTLCLMTIFISIGLHARVAAQETNQINPSIGSDSNFKLNFQRKLLEFVSPQNQNELLRDALVASMLNASPIADQFQSRAIASLRYDQESKAMEHQAKELEQLGRLDSLKGKGINRSIVGIQSRGLRTQVNAMVLELQKQAAATAYERRHLGRDNRLTNMRELPITPLTAATGGQQNYVLSTIQNQVLEFGYSVSIDTPLGNDLTKLTLDNDVLSKIRLQIIREGGNISFDLLEGSTAIKSPPFLLRQAKLDEQLKRVVDLQDQLRIMNTSDVLFVEKTIELRESLDNLMASFEKKMGTAHEAARKGQEYYNTWRKVRDYFTGIKAIVKCLELENDPSILRSDNKYDPKKYGNGILPLVTFVVTNGCTFAPAKPGNELAYVFLHRRLVELQALLSQ